ncbi:hypothetical protein LINPERHAP2_LOCUS3210 [Linum perenne]
MIYDMLLLRIMCAIYMLYACLRVTPTFMLCHVR